MMYEMIAINSTDVRKEFGSFIDEIVRVKPIVVKRSRDFFMGISIPMMQALLKDVKFSYQKFEESDGSYTLSLQDIDIVVNEDTYEDAVDSLVEDLKEYCMEYYEDFNYWNSAPNRNAHLPYVLKALICNSDEELKDELICQVGKN